MMVNELIELLRAGSLGANAYARVQGLFTVVDDTCLHQFHHGFGQCLGVYAQVLLVHQVPCNGVRQCPDAQLDGGPVLHQFRHIICNGLCPGVNFRPSYGVKAGLGRYDIINLIQGNLLASKGGHLGIDLCNDTVRCPGSRLREAACIAKAAHPLLIRFRNLDECPVRI